MTSTSKDRPDTSTADPSKILTEFIIESYKEAEEICSSGIGISGAACGYPTLDRMLMGLRPGQLIVIGGRPAIGKSAFALNLALNAASEGYSVVIFSLEMPGREVAQRLICMNAQINISNFRTGRISPQEWANINEATKDLSRLDIQIKDTPRMTLPEIQSEAARALQGKEKGIVILDNMQLVRQPADRRFDSLAEEVTDLSHELKICARELDVPLIALSQLSRAIETRTNLRPQLSDLRESGSIEHDADIVMLLDRSLTEEELWRDDRPPEGMTRVTIAKNRIGPTGDVDLVFLPASARYYELNEHADD